MFPEYNCVKGNKCLSCNKCYSKKLNEELKEKFKSTFKFSNNDINKFILLLRKGVYSYETTLSERKEFYRNLNLEYITDADYMHAKRARRDFQIKNIGEYRDFCFKSEVLLSAGIFKNVREMCLKIYELYPLKFISVPGLVWQAVLKKTEVKL